MALPIQYRLIEKVDCKYWLQKLIQKVDCKVWTRKLDKSGNG